MEKDRGAREKIQQLMDSYDSIVYEGKKSRYSEADVGSKFILPLLSALGWDITKIEDVKEQRRTLTGIADYSLLNIGGTSKIFLELKKFEEDLDGSRRVGGKIKSFPQMAIDYAWQSRADWAVLTNFEEIRLYYSRVKKPEEGLIFKLKYHEYLTKFEKLWLLSKESVVSGLLDTYEKRRLRREIDEELLKDLVYCRRLLVSNVRKNHPQLSKDELNEATQKILDRLMFIRSCEDRLIIPAESLWTQFSVWQKIAIDKTVRTFMMDLKNIFRDFDAVYNGKLFAPHLCEDLRVENEVLEAVLILLYNYNFDLIPVDVLGNAYELYIGTIIKEKEGILKEDELTLVEDPTVRKKHGIYYTPEYVVDYIVRNTSGKLLKECETVEDVSKIKVLDPACGSGSFLIKAFDMIKEWYDRYNKINQLAATPNTLDAHLHAVPNIEEKILTNNLYGVDLDPQAVEITMLNLSLKAVKSKEKLPFMGDHIKCGNSLISGLNSELEIFFKKSQERKPFNWHNEFPEIFEQGGFDVIVANPPYYSVHLMKDDEMKKYLQNIFNEIFTSDSDIHYFFYARGIELLRPHGLLGFISSRYFIEGTLAERFRRFIQNRTKIRVLIDFGSKVRIFKGSSINTAIVILEKCENREERERNKIKVVKVFDWNNDILSLLQYIESHLEENVYSDKHISIFNVPQSRLNPQLWILLPKDIGSVIRKIEEMGAPLSEMLEAYKGIDTGMDRVSGDHIRKAMEEQIIFQPPLSEGEEVFTVTEETIRRNRLEHALLRPLLKNQNVRRYCFEHGGRYVIMTTDDIDISEYPNIEEHLQRYKPLLEKRHFLRDAPWYTLRYLGGLNVMLSKKDRLMTPFVAPENRFALIKGEDGYICTTDMYYIVAKDNCPIDLKYVLGILNSKLMNFYHKNTAKAVDGKARTSYGIMRRRFQYLAGHISRYPLRVPASPNEIKIHDEITELVPKMIDLVRRNKRIMIDFKKYLTEPILGYMNFRKYYDKLSMESKEVIDNTSKGTIKRIKIEEQNFWLTFKADYFTTTDRTKEEFTDTPVLRCKFEEASFRKFLLHVFQGYKKRWGTGNILSIILKASIPFFDKNPEKNNQIIEKIMKEFLKAVEEKERLEKEIQQTDNAIDAKVYELYGLTPEEISLIESSLKQK